MNAPCTLAGTITRKQAAYSDKEAYGLLNSLGHSEAWKDPRFRAWSQRKFPPRDSTRRGFDDSAVHPDDPCQSKGRL